MKEHTMRLRPEPFEKIRTGHKTIELRLYDEKRQQISVGDRIRFINTDELSKELHVVVKKLDVFDSFAELYRALPLTECGYREEELLTASPKDMEAYYSKEEQTRYGVVGIKIEVNNMDEWMELAEIMTASEEIFDGHVVHLFKDTVRLPNGKPAVRETVRHIGAVTIVPVTDDGKVIVERQFRYPLNEVITEIPAGKLDSKSEDRLEAAKRELAEETGYSAEEWICLGDYYPAAAYTDERITMYLARGLRRGERKLDEDEFLNVAAVSMEELVQEILAGRIADGKTQAAVLKAYLMMK